MSDSLGVSEVFLFLFNISFQQLYSKKLNYILFSFNISLYFILLKSVKYCF
jgi:hypothetical protein